MCNLKKNYFILCFIINIESVTDVHKNLKKNYYFYTLLHDKY